MPLFFYILQAKKVVVPVELEVVPDVFQIQLLPKTSCTCLEKVICCHILAVQFFKGAEIDKRFNLPSLSQVILANNDQQKTGRKMRGHEKNSKPSRMLNEEEALSEMELVDGAVLVILIPYFYLSNF